MDDVNVDDIADNFNTITTGLEITVLTKEGGPMSKHIHLDASGKVVSDGSSCSMSLGSAERFPVPNLAAFADQMERMESNQAFALGRLHDGAPDTIHIVTKKVRAEPDMVGRSDVTARCADAFRYEPGQLGLALIDYDMKGMSQDVKDNVAAVSGVYHALESVLPGIVHAGQVLRRSTSAGLYRTDSGEVITGSGGAHVYLLVMDGADIPRFLKALHERCWLAGFGWFMVGEGGQLLERSIVDRMVYAPERLAFEGAPVVDPPLAQNSEKRRPQIQDGIALDTYAACPDLNEVEKSKLKTLLAEARQRMKPEAEKARGAFIEHQMAAMVEKHGVSPLAARKTVEKQLEGILLPHAMLVFNSDELGEVTVAQILADPEKYVGATLADPIEGVSYGRGKAKVMRRPDGSIWIHSFAHGRVVYDLRFDVVAIKAAIEAAPESEAVDLLERLLLVSDLETDELQTLVEYVAKRAKVGLRPLKARLKEKDEARAKSEKNERTERKAAAKGKPIIDLPGMMLAPTVDLTERTLINMEWPIYQRGHNLVRAGYQEFDASDGRKVKAPALIPHTNGSLDYGLSKAITWMGLNPKGELVECDPPPISQTMLSLFGQWKYRRANGITSTPSLRPDGTILDTPGFDEATGIYYLHDPGLVVPRICDEPNRAHALMAVKMLEELLTEFPFVDDVSHAVALSGLITPCVRAAMPVVPLHGFSARSAGTGKSYLTDVASSIATGRICPVSSANANPEETEKHLAALMLSGAQIFSLDNLDAPLSGGLLCQATERRLVRVRPFGVLKIDEIELVATPYATGNNLTASGDMTRRVIRSEMDAKTERPELRVFHGDPVQTVLANRGMYVAACLVISRAYLAAGKPGKLPPIASYEAWSDLVRSALVWLGRADPAASMETVRDDDEKLSADKIVLTAWKGYLGLDEAYTTKEIIEKASTPATLPPTDKTDVEIDKVREPLRVAIHDALMAVASDKGGRISSDALGLWLRKNKGQVKNGHRIMQGGMIDGYRTWKMEKMG